MGIFRKGLLVVGAVVAAGFFLDRVGYEPRQRVAPADDAADGKTPAHEAAAAYFTSDSEPMVRGAAWSGRYALDLVMDDDGSVRDGFARYACELLAARGLGRDLVVRVHSAAAITARAEKTRIGLAKCSDYSGR